MTTSTNSPRGRAVDGYTIEMRYHYGYLTYLSPSWLRLALTACGIAFPQGWPLRYLELGYGTGVALNIHAAACPGEYWGTDANPEHADYARKLAAAAGTNVNALDLTFSQLIDHPGLPQFDIITAPGIWSWISAQNRAHVVELLARKLAPGGVFFLTYNAMPGMAPAIPLQRLLRLHADLACPDRDGYAQMEGSLRFASQLAATDSYFSAYPKIKKALEDISQTNAVYNIHEYMGHNWQPCFFAEVASDLQTAGLSFAGSAQFDPQIDDTETSPDVRAVLGAIDDPTLKETARDYLRNTTFRQDIFVKDPRRLDDAVRRALLAPQLFHLTRPADEIDLRLPPDEPGQAFALPKDRARVATGVLDALGKHERAMSAKELVGYLPSAMPIEDVIRALLDLMNLRVVLPVCNSPGMEARAACRRLNAHFRDEWLVGRGIYALASPVAEAGLHISTWHYAFELARTEGAEGVPTLMDRAKKLMTKHTDPDAPETGNEARQAVKALRAAILHGKSETIRRALEIEVS